MVAPAHVSPIGPEGVRDAIELLGADRIDHGVRAIEDPALVELLADRQIPLGICPTSNLTLGVYASIYDHPIDRLLLGCLESERPLYLRERPLEQLSQRPPEFGKRTVAEARR